jgi:hypothetical protein
MVESSRNERLTAFVSTVVAVAILAAGVTATQQQDLPADDVTRAVADLRFQFDMAFRHDEREREDRLAQLEALVNAWEKSPQSADDRASLFKWLQESAGRSLPGALAPLPAVPEFSRPAPAVVHEVKKVPVDEKPIVVTPPQPVVTNSTVAGPAVANKPIVENTITPTPSDPLEEEMVALRQPPSLAPGEATVANVDKPALAPRPAGQEQPKLVPGKLLTSVAVKEDQATEPVGVNLTELAARIAGYHDALDEVETALMRLEAPSLDVVIAQIAQLDRMTRDYGFVTLYYGSLTSKEQEQVIEPRSMKSTLTEVNRQLDRCAETLDGDFLGSFDQAAVQEIAGLRAKVKAIGERVASSER